MQWPLRESIECGKRHSGQKALPLLLFFAIDRTVLTTSGGAGLYTIHY